MVSSFWWGLERFYRRVKNLFRWLPTIWNDMDYDDYFIFELLKIKLTYQAKYIGQKNRHTKSKYHAEKMMLCVRLIDKIQNEYYSIEYMDYNVSKYHMLDVSDKPDLKEIKIEEVSETYDNYFSKHKAAVRKILSDKKYQIFPLNDPISYKRRLAMNLGHYNESRAKELLFKILNQHIRSWWD